ncbi:hypothetical protein [Spiroplasma sp. AdecLV25b]|uniref:hypothetical protein n=1 Tax=Spiroplasma sp. AdecLV25b TaxID=3027162 RepID=UPI0027E0147C|nr:hypothetical protein [Spiroplasma sp. AdecLV25b]
MFNWTTQYKTNHDEYEETEETTFSYPASILSPDPMNVAKQIVIIPTNPSLEINFDNALLFDMVNREVFYYPNQW